jgi:hypothetical protein
LIPSPHDGAKIIARRLETSPVSTPAELRLLLCSPLRRGGGGRRDRQNILSEGTTMIILGILLSFAAIGFFCWLLFTLAVFALPLLGSQDAERSRQAAEGAATCGA